MNNQYLYHIVLIDNWGRFKDLEFYVSETFDEEKFIHLSSENQVEATLNRYYADFSQILILKISAEKILEFIKFEESPSGEIFPHLYQSLPIKAVFEVLSFQKTSELWSIEL